MLVEDLVLLIPPVDLREGEREGGREGGREKRMLSFIQKITIIICKSFTLNNFGYYIKNKSGGGLNVCILTNSTNFCAKHIHMYMY